MVEPERDGSEHMVHEVRYGAAHGVLVQLFLACRGCPVEAAGDTAMMFFQRTIQERYARSSIFRRAASGAEGMLFSRSWSAGWDRSVASRPALWHAGTEMRTECVSWRHGLSRSYVEIQGPEGAW